MTKRRIQWGTALLTLAITIAVVWIAGRWLLRFFLRVQGGHG